VEFRTQRLTIRPWRADDDPEVRRGFDIYRRMEVARWLGGTPDPWPDLTEAKRRLGRWSDYEGEHPGYGLWAVVPDDATPRLPAGTVLLMPLHDADERPTGHVEIGWHFHPDSWGHGYATEASQRVLEHAWTLGLDRVEAIALADNEASLAVMRRLGMTYAGTTDRWYGTTFEWYRIDRP
jgi:RimJ/RimL family protein N-acetyltransferase